MSAPFPKCKHCGAAIRDPDRSCCDFCGVAFVSTPQQQTPSAPDRFRALRAHADYRRLMELEPLPVEEPLGVKLTAVFCTLLFVVFLLVFVAGLASVASGGAVAAVIGMWGMSLAWAGYRSKRHYALKRVNASVERAPVHVLDKRTQLGGAAYPEAIYYLTLEHDDGTRREVSAPSLVAGLVSRGELGVAYLDSGRLIDFRSLPFFPSTRAATQS